MPEYRVTITNCTLEVRHVIAKDEDEAEEKADDIVCTQAAKTPFDVWTGDFEAKEE